MLTAIGPTGKNKHNRMEWLCVCGCGETCTTVSGELFSGDTKSCGCQSSRLTIGKRSTTHRLGGTPEHRSWSQMKGRCKNPNNHKYLRYGGRGISVCGRWNKFENFLSDMGKKPSKHHSIDRIDNDGNYEPTNCRWATPRQQSNNTRRNVLLTHNGKTLTLAQWSRRTGIKHTTINDRINKHGWTVESALTKPVQIKYRNSLTGPA